jgi:Fe-S-cluster containining protein
MSQFSFSPRIDVPIAQLFEEDRHLLRLVDAALVDAAHRSGEHLACHPGCTPCCHGAFAISVLDALRLRAAIAELAGSDPSLAAAIAARAHRYLEEHGPYFPGDRETGILSNTPEADAAFAEFANDAPCPALNPSTGHCDLYAARPMTCRTFGPPVRHASEVGEGFAVCELCFTSAAPEEIEEAEMHVPRKEEQLLLGRFPDNAGETIVAYCLTLPPAAPQPTVA